MVLFYQISLVCGSRRQFFQDLPVDLAIGGFRAGFAKPAADWKRRGIEGQRPGVDPAQEAVHLPQKVPRVIEPVQRPARTEEFDDPVAVRRLQKTLPDRIAEIDTDADRHGIPVGQLVSALRAGTGILEPSYYNTAWLIKYFLSLFA